MVVQVQKQAMFGWIVGAEKQEELAKQKSAERRLPKWNQIELLSYLQVTPLPAPAVIARPFFFLQLEIDSAFSTKPRFWAHTLVLN